MSIESAKLSPQQILPVVHPPRDIDASSGRVRSSCEKLCRGCGIPFPDNANFEEDYACCRGDVCVPNGICLQPEVPRMNVGEDIEGGMTEEQWRLLKTFYED